MKVTLVFYEHIKTNRQGGFGYASYRLARNLLDRGLLDQVICRFADSDVEIPPDKIQVMHRHPLYRFLIRVIARVYRLFPWLNIRRLSEQLFDRFVGSRIDLEPGSLLFTTRPLILNTVRRAKAGGMKVWLFASVPHPLVNYSLTRHEEMRHGLAKSGAATDSRRTERLAGAMVLADRIVTLGPEIGEYVHGTFRHFIEPDRLLSLKEFFTFDPNDLADRAEERLQRRVEGGVTFFHVSHLHLVKGITYLLEAWRRFKATDKTGSRLVIAGVVHPQLKTVVDRDYADLPDVEFLGFVPDLASCFAAADVFVSPSITDAGPVTIIEAMAMGLPVISSNNCGFASLLTDGEDGYRYEFNDVPALEAILRKVAEDPADLSRLGRNALDNVKNRSLDRYVQELTGLIEQQGT